jgi:hypothetical protein
MKRIAATFGVVAAMAVLPAAANAGTSSKKAPIHKSAKPGLSLQIRVDRSSNLYRLGNSGLWMQ